MPSKNKKNKKKKKQQAKKRAAEAAAQRAAAGATDAGEQESGGSATVLTEDTGNKQAVVTAQPGNDEKEKPKDPDDVRKQREEMFKAIYGYRDPSKKMDELSIDKKHEFWDNQPVPKMTDVIEEHGPIEKKTVDEVMKDPYPLPQAFEWTDIDMNNQEQAEELYQLLSSHYVEDDDNMFRFDYSRDFLTWALKAPGYKKMWHCGVRVKSNKKLVACITAIPATVQVYDSAVEMVEINFLCVHKKLRSKRLSPVLIKEITRRVNITNRWQAVYTAGVVLPKPVARNRYYHRSLNPKKLIDIGFSRLPPKLTMRTVQRLYKVPDEPLTPGLRELRPSDVEEATNLLMTYLQKFKLHVNFTTHEFQHWFMSRPDVVYTYVVEDPETGKLTDMFSFYSLPSTIINNPNYKLLKAAYNFYNVSNKTPWKQLMLDALVMAAKNGFDVFNALDVMDNMEFMDHLKFGIGDGHLQYYLYNWKCPEIPSKGVGLVLL